MPPVLSSVRIASVALAVLWSLAVPMLRAQSPSELAIPVRAVVNLTDSSAPAITLAWPADTPAPILSQTLRRRAPGAPAWEPPIVLPPDATSYTDPLSRPGVACEYSFTRTFADPSRPPAQAYLLAAADLPIVEQRGRLILLVDDTLAPGLASDLETLSLDLAGDGWIVRRQDISPASTPAAVKNILRALRAEDPDPATPTALYLLGHIPVPYSGKMAPDGHTPDHYGAWPADTYYADLDGLWTDSSSPDTRAADPRNHNLPGDGKLDQYLLPSPPGQPFGAKADAELQTGRVDLTRMESAAPPGFTSLALHRQYLLRAHQFRHLAGPYADIPRRALITDKFGFFGGESFATSAWRSAYAIVGDSPSVRETIAQEDWFPGLASAPALYAYACAPGTPSVLQGVASLSDFASRDSRAVFTQLFGSYIGDWDMPNSLLRAPLAGTPGSLGLACAWSGRPYHHLHSLALGATLGRAIQMTQNNRGSDANGYTGGNTYGRFTCIALMGDPALRLHPAPPPIVLNADLTDSDPALVLLSWPAPPPSAFILGHHLYASETPDGPRTRLTGLPASPDDPGGSPLAPDVTTFLLPAPAPGRTLYYHLRALTREVTPAGTYLNLSQPATAILNVPLVPVNRPAPRARSLALASEPSETKFQPDSVEPPSVPNTLTFSLAPVPAKAIEPEPEPELEFYDTPEAEPSETSPRPQRILRTQTDSASALPPSATDTDHDSLPDLLENALGTDPDRPDAPAAAAPPPPVLLPDGSLRYTFDYNPAATHLSLTLQTTTDLLHWTDLASAEPPAPFDYAPFAPASLDLQELALPDGRFRIHATLSQDDLKNDLQLFRLLVTPLP